MMIMRPLIYQEIRPCVIHKSTSSPCSVCCCSCTDTGGDVEHCKWLGEIYADGTLIVRFTTETSGNEKLCR